MPLFEIFQQSFIIHYWLECEGRTFSQIVGQYKMVQSMKDLSNAIPLYPHLFWFPILVTQGQQQSKNIKWNIPERNNL